MVKLFPETRRSLSHLFRHGWAPTKKQEERGKEAFFGILRRPWVPPLLFYTEAVCRAIVGEEGRMGVKVITSPDPRREEEEEEEPTEEEKKHGRQEDSFI